jgi:hypothetical protein
MYHAPRRVDLRSTSTSCRLTVDTLRESTLQPIAAEMDGFKKTDPDSDSDTDDVRSTALHLPFLKAHTPIVPILSPARMIFIMQLPE